MKKGGGKTKGCEFERTICRRLTYWITGEEKPEIFWRSASSGAKATQDEKSGVKSKMGGDIVSVADEGSWLTNTFSIECKSYHQVDFKCLLLGKGNIISWWDQCKRDAVLSNKFPMLIFKGNRTPVYIMLSYPIRYNKLSSLIWDKNELSSLRWDKNYIYLLEEVIEQVDFVAFSVSDKGLHCGGGITSQPYMV